tara:strand:+ start:232 stop:657 length:426 start_codon:yes stop_codon:yes gene_type:complete
MAFADVPRLQASLSISSPNLTNDSLSLTSTTQFKKAGTSVALDQTSGVGRKTTTATTQYTLFDGSDYVANGAHKVYIRNASAIDAEFVTVILNSEELGRLYAGDFMLMPYGASADTNDIKITPSVSSTLTVEYAIFSQASV